MKKSNGNNFVKMFDEIYNLEREINKKGLDSMRVSKSNSLMEEQQSQREPQ